MGLFFHEPRNFLPRQLLTLLVDGGQVMPLSQSQQRFASMVGKLLAFVETLPGYAVTFGETYRTPEQAALYAAQGKGSKTSLHCHRLAVDLNLFINGIYQTQTFAYKELGDFWKSLGGTWGGDFPRADGNHFEYRG